MFHSRPTSHLLTNEWLSLTRHLISTATCGSNLLFPYTWASTNLLPSPQAYLRYLFVQQLREMLHLRILLNLRKSGKPCSRKARSVSGQAGAAIGFSPPIVGSSRSRDCLTSLGIHGTPLQRTPSENFLDKHYCTNVEKRVHRQAVARNDYAHKHNTDRFYLLK